MNLLRDQFKESSGCSFRVCLIMPENNPHTLCFREIALLLAATLKSMGYPCDFTINQLDREKINIILGYHLLTFESGLKNYHYIPYQMEQLHSNEFPFSENMEAILGNALEVWDYSDKNIFFLAQKGIAARKLVPGYHPGLELIKPASNKSVDVLFYGSVGERRRKLLEELSARCRVKVLFGVYGEKRDKWISRSRIVLNFHHYSLQIFEAVRVSYLINNHCLVISETSEDYPYPKVNLPFAGYDVLTETCMKFLQEQEKGERIREENYRQFKTHYPMREHLKNLLSR